MSDVVLDQWQLALQEQKEKLALCQQEHQQQSCLSCEKVLACELRDAYVKAVYDSMSKGKGGGFEF
jgi:hypothetical protein